MELIIVAALAVLSIIGLVFLVRYRTKLDKGKCKNCGRPSSQTFCSDHCEKEWTEGDVW